MRYVLNHSLYRNPALGAVATKGGITDDVLSVVKDERKRTQAVFVITLITVSISLLRWYEQRNTNKLLREVLHKR